jgi:hypothetical protein
VQLNFTVANNVILNASHALNPFFTVSGPSSTLHPKDLVKQSKLSRQQRVNSQPEALKHAQAVQQPAAAGTDARVVSSVRRQSESLSGISRGIAQSEGHALNERFLSGRLEALASHSNPSHVQSLAQRLTLHTQPDSGLMKRLEVLTPPVQWNGESIPSSYQAVSGRHQRSSGQSVSPHSNSDMQVYT